MKSKGSNDKKIIVKKSLTATAAAAPQTAAELAKLGQDLLAQQRAIRQAIPDFLMPHESRATLTGTPSRVTDVAVKEGLAASAQHVALSGAIDAASHGHGVWPLMRSCRVRRNRVSRK